MLKCIPILKIQLFTVISQLSRMENALFPERLASVYSTSDSLGPLLILHIVETVILFFASWLCLWSLSFSDSSSLVIIMKGLCSSHLRLLIIGLGSIVEDMVRGRVCSFKGIIRLKNVGFVRFWDKIMVRSLIWRRVAYIKH